MKLINQMWAGIGFACGVSAMALIHAQGITRSDLAITIGIWAMVALVGVLLAIAERSRA